MTAEGGSGEAPPDPSVEPDSGEPAFPVPAPDQALRGAALLGLSAGLVWTTLALARKVGAPAMPLVAALSATALLSAWAAVIHLTGGERFDDHPLL